MTVLVTKPAVNIREELADLKDQTTYDTVKSAGALMDVELTNEAAVKSINQALTTTSDVAFNQVTAALVGNASTATTLETARDIALSGDVTGSASFNGNANITITATVADDSHNHTISNVDGLQTALDAKQPLLAEGAFVDGDKTKLDGIEATADVTDATNVEAAGAVMDGDFTSNGFMKRTGAGTYTIDASTYLTEGSALNDISDVTITGTPANNEILAYDTTAGAFINQTAAEAGVAALSGAAFTGDVSLDTRLLLADGTAASPAIGFTNDSDSGLYYSGGAVRVAFNGAQTFAFGVGIAYSDDLLPSVTETSALGGTLNRWNTFYTVDGDFSGNVTLGDGVGDTITVNGTISANGQYITPTELGYIANVTSDVQAQLNSAATTGNAIAMAMIFG